MTIVTRSKKQKKSGLIQEVQEELKKVHWTSRAELKMFTKIVIGSTLFFGISIYLTDLTIREILSSIGYLCQWIVG
ncbi:MAG: preprotein translocase subunit SecE [Chlamydiota bacterium]